MIQRNRAPLKTPLFVTGVYCVLSCLWIFLSDRLLLALRISEDSLTVWSTLKGFAYVAVSGGFIYAILRRLHRTNLELEDTVASRTSALADKHRTLQRQADTLRTFIDGAPVGMAMFDRDMRYLEASSRWCKDYDLDRSSILGKVHYDVVPIQPERWREMHRRGLEGEVLRCEQDSYLDAAGVEHWLRWEIRPWTESGSDQIGGIIIFTENMSEQHTLERQLLQAQKMEAVGQLAGGIAHDFNNLLMVVMSYAELIREQPVINGRVADYAAKISEAGNKAKVLTKQLLAFGRRQPQELSYVDINAVVSGLCKMLPNFIGEDIEFVQVASADAGVVHADKSQLEQVIMNLVVNARDAMPSGGRLVVETSNVELGADFSQKHGASVPPGEYVVLSITDTGCGMDEATQQRIFEPFFTTKPVGKGTGLGLSTVYGIVKQNRGFVWVYSELGQGTTFKVYLPRIRASAHSPAGLTPARAEGNGTGSETLLIVEDQSALREVIGEFLGSHGYHLILAENAAVALRLAEETKEPIHLLLTDIVMPGMRGPDLAQKIVHIHPEARVMYMSGYSDLALTPAGAPGVAFVQKPMALGKLAEKIREVLGQDV